MTKLAGISKRKSMQGQDLPGLPGSHRINMVKKPVNVRERNLELSVICIF